MVSGSEALLHAYAWHREKNLESWTMPRRSMVFASGSYISALCILQAYNWRSSVEKLLQSHSQIMQTYYGFLWACEVPMRLAPKKI